MKRFRLFPLFLCGLILCMTRISNAVQTTVGGVFIPSIANSATLPVPGAAGLTSGSNLFRPIPSTCGSVTVSFMLQSGQSSWTGQAHLYGSTGTQGGITGATVYPRYDQIDGTNGTTAISANFVGTVTFPVPTGSAGIIFTSLTGVAPLVAILPGPSLPSSLAGGSTAANQTTALTSLSSILSQLQSTLAVSVASLPLPSGAATATNQNAGKGTPLIAASVLGSISGTYVSGTHKIAQIVSENASASTVYLQVYPGTSQPSNGTVPMAEMVVGFGISSSPTGNRLVMTPDYLSTTTGIWFCFVIAPGAFNSANLVSSGTGLLVRVYGQ